MSTELVQTFIDKDLFERASAKAVSEDKTLDVVLASLIEDWVGIWQPPTPPPVPQPSPSPSPGFQIYIVQSGDTLSGIAKRFYGNPNKYPLIAQFNSIADPRRIFPSMKLRIPDLAPVPPPVTPPPPPPVPTPPLRPDYPPIPDGLAQIEQVFGQFEWEEDVDSRGRVRLLDNWEYWNIRLIRDVPALPGGKIYGHKLLEPAFRAVFSEITDKGLASSLRTYDGCFIARHKMWDPGRDLSAHSWGIAIDLNAATNMPGMRGDMDPKIIEIFRAHGFKWGGDFGDPMHFQYCVNY
jgi:LysM repeat protein